jgi:hypothetical protein
VTTLLEIRLPASRPVLISAWDAFRCTARPMVVAVAVSLLGQHVVRILSVCAEKQVFRIAARRIVAAVAHEARIIFRYLAERQFVGYAMGMGRSAVQPEFPVAVCSDVADPLPASIRLLYARPEPSRGVGAFVIVAAFLRTVLSDLRDAVGHQRSASSARLRDTSRANTDPAIRVAPMRAEATDLARPPHEVDPARNADAFSLRRVVLSESLVPLHKHVSHICLV